VKEMKRKQAKGDGTGLDLTHFNFRTLTVFKPPKARQRRTTHRTRKSVRVATALHGAIRTTPLIALPNKDKLQQRGHDGIDEKIAETLLSS